MDGSGYRSGIRFQRRMFNASSWRYLKLKPWANTGHLFRYFSCGFLDSTQLPVVLVWPVLSPQVMAACNHFVNLTCRYLTLCQMRLSPMPSCSCLGRRAVTPSPRPAVRGPWRSSTPYSQQRNVSATAWGQHGAAGTSRAPPSCSGGVPPASLRGQPLSMPLRTVASCPPRCRGGVTLIIQGAVLLTTKGRGHLLLAMLFPGLLLANSRAGLRPPAR